MQVTKAVKERIDRKKSLKGTSESTRKNCNAKKTSEDRKRIRELARACCKVLLELRTSTNPSKDIRFIHLFNGRKLLMVDGFTFHKIAGVSYTGGIRWQCSSRKSEKCKAFVVLSENEDVVLRVVGFHTHVPPSYKLTKQGTYIKA